jgi:hypothetical protein
VCPFGASLPRLRHSEIGEVTKWHICDGSRQRPTGNVHEVAQQSAPDARVVYVDSEAVAVSYSRRKLEDVPGAMMVDADIRDIDQVLAAASRLLDFEQPVAVLMFAVLHFVIDDQQVAELVASYRDRTTPGSWLALSHGCADDNPTIVAVQEAYRTTTLSARVRSRAAITDLFDGYELVEPGVVYVQDWRAEEHDGEEKVDPAALCGWPGSAEPRVGGTSVGATSRDRAGAARRRMTHLHRPAARRAGRSAHRGSVLQVGHASEVAGGHRRLHPVGPQRRLGLRPALTDT